MQFRGPWWFLSNMCPSPIEYEGLAFTCAEAAYQAAKFIRIDDRRRFVGIDGFAAKRLARQLERTGRRRPDWMTARVSVMRAALALKFANPALMVKLRQTPQLIEETNTWGDAFWGRCNGVGQNVLGLLLMELRDGRPYLNAA